MSLRSRKILLVEGQTDKELFEGILKHCGLHVDVEPITPRQAGRVDDGKGPAIQSLEDFLDELVQGNLTHLGVVLDADSPRHGQGFQRALDAVADKLSSRGYERDSETGAGMIFNHSDGLYPVGLWIMPDNRSDGICEEWMCNAALESERCLVNFAVESVSSLPVQKFKEHHRSKVHVATWLAWQQPGSIDPLGLLELSQGVGGDLIQWLNTVYTKE
jgi:hypothetical protein